jgi:hypothetical protein
MVKMACVSEYKTELCMTPDFFGETIHDTEHPYVSEYHIIDNDKNNSKCTLMNYQSNTYNPGKYSNLKYIKGSMCIDKKKVKYFAFYFCTFDKSNLLNVNDVDDEKDVKKYTFCIQHIIGDKTKTVDELAEIAKKIKSKYIEINSK